VGEGCRSTGSGCTAKQKPRRISLPTYPFAKERYWIEASAQPAAADTGGGSNGSVPYPLLYRDTSDLSAQRFSARLSGDEPYLRLIDGARVLPEAAHLEMARAAVEAAAGKGAQAKVRLEQAEWQQPVVLGPDGLELHVELFADEDGRTAYEIYSAGEAGERVIHSQGWAVVQPIGEAEHPHAADVDEDVSGTLLSQRAWQPRLVEADAASSHGQHWVLLCGRDEWARQVEAEVASALPRRAASWSKAAVRE